MIPSVPSLFPSNVLQKTTFSLWHKKEGRKSVVWIIHAAENKKKNKTKKNLDYSFEICYL